MAACVVCSGDYLSSYIYRGLRKQAKFSVRTIRQSGVLLVQLTASEMIEEFIALYGTRRFIFMLVKVRHSTLIVKDMRCHIIPFYLFVVYLMKLSVVKIV
jgi:hypothetical protein